MGRGVGQRKTYAGNASKAPRSGKKPRPKPEPGAKVPVLLSFQPHISGPILEVEEAVELRTHRAGCEAGTPMAMYTSGHIKKIEGTCIVEEVIEETPKDLWERGAKNMGLSEEDYFGYFENSKKAYAFILTDIKRLEKPVPLPFRGPQSFRYLYDDDLEHNELLLNTGIIEETPETPEDSETESNLNNLQ